MRMIHFPRVKRAAPSICACKRPVVPVLFLAERMQLLNHEHSTFHVKTLFRAGIYHNEKIQFQVTDRHQGRMWFRKGEEGVQVIVKY